MSYTANVVRTRFTAKRRRLRPFTNTTAHLSCAPNKSREQLRWCGGPCGFSFRVKHDKSEPEVKQLAIVTCMCCDVLCIHCRTEEMRGNSWNLTEVSHEIAVLIFSTLEEALGESSAFTPWSLGIEMKPCRKASFSFFVDAIWMSKFARNKFVFSIKMMLPLPQKKVARSRDHLRRRPSAAKFFWHWQFFFKTHEKCRFSTLVTGSGFEAATSQ